MFRQDLNALPVHQQAFSLGIRLPYEILLGHLVFPKDVWLPFDSSVQVPLLLSLKSSCMFLQSMGYYRPRTHSIVSWTGGWFPSTVLWWLDGKSFGRFTIAHDMFHFRQGRSGVEHLRSLGRCFSCHADSFCGRSNRRNQHSSCQQPITKR